MGRDAKKYDCLTFVQNSTFFQRREIPIGLILTQPVIKCQSHINKKIQMPFHTNDKACERTCEQLTTLLKEDCPFRRSLCRIVLDESHIVYTWRGEEQSREEGEMAEKKL